MDGKVTPFLEEKWKQGFRLLDQDKDGVLTMEDYAAIADNISKKTGATEEEAVKTRQEWVKFYALVQPDPSKQGDLKAFLPACRELYKNPEHHAELNRTLASDLFNRIDFDKDGAISFGELAIFYEAIGVTDKDAMLTAFENLDKDGDGLIQRDDFVDDFVGQYCNPDPITGKTYLHSPCTK